MDINIRQLVPEDAAQYKDLRVKALQTDADAFLMTMPEENDFDLDHVKKKIETDYALGAFDQEKLVGSLLLIRQVPLKFRHIGILGGMYVDPAYRNKGIGRQLIEAMLKYIKTLPDVYSLQLKVVTDNIPALNLYESFGFKTWAAEKNALKDGERFLDQFHMMYVVER